MKARELQANARAEVSRNGKGIDPRGERNQAEEAYPRKEQEQASLSSVNRRRSEGLRGVGEVIWPGERWSGGGVQRGSSRSGQFGRWLTGWQRRSGLSGRVALTLCPPASARKKKAGLTSGPGVSAAQRTRDRPSGCTADGRWIWTGRLGFKKGDRAVMKWYAIYAVELGS